MASVKIGIIDDGYPTIEQHISVEEISGLAVEDWGSEEDLRQLNFNLVKESLRFNHRIQLEAFKHPNFYFNKDDWNWDVLVFDWEYKPETNSHNDLLEILQKTTCPIYIYSAWDKIDDIPTLLQAEEFTPFREQQRYEILSKGDSDSGRRILEKVMHCFLKGEDISWEGIDFRLIPSKYVVDFDDFWKLRFLLGKEFLREFISKEKVIDEGQILNLFSLSRYKFFINRNKTILSSSKSELLESFAGELMELSMIDTLKAVGIDKMEEAKEKGYTEIH